jgi:hypothetical protein
MKANVLPQQIEAAIAAGKKVFVSLNGESHEVLSARYFYGVRQCYVIGHGFKSYKEVKIEG